MQCVKPDSFQIISAGEDGVFGPGTNPKTGEVLWDPSRGTTDPAGRDDLSNFALKRLGR